LQTDLELNNKFQLILDYKNKKLKGLPGLLSQSKKKGLIINNLNLKTN
jgi:hypothetical protein